MKKTARILSVIIAAVMICACLPLAASADSGDGIIMQGIVAYYDGANNSNGDQDLNASVWRDLSGNGYHFAVETDENTKWKTNAFHVEKKRTYFNENVKTVANAKQYTIEMAFGELEYFGTDWLTLVASDNDEFSMFIRVQDGLDQLEYKYNDNNRDRPMADKGKDLVSNSTLSVTFDIDVPICVIYIDGEQVASGVPVECNIADTLFFGHEDPKRAWTGDVYSFRFYDRVLSVDEIKHNVQVDNDKYRSGREYIPTVVDTGENGGEVTTREKIDYKVGDVITIADFSDPATFQKMVKAEPQRCSVEMDDSGAVKITVTGNDPYFYIPIDETNSFDGDTFFTLILTYRTEGEINDDLAEIYFSRKFSQEYFTDNHIQFFMEESPEFKDLEIDMRDCDNDTWHNEIRMIRVGPAKTSCEGQVYYLKSVKARCDDPNKPIGGETTAADTAEETTGAVTTVPDETTAEPAGTQTEKAPAATTAESGSSGGPNVGLIIGIICGVVAAACIVVFIVMKAKKK